MVELKHAFHLSLAGSSLVRCDGFCATENDKWIKPLFNSKFKSKWVFNVFAIDLFHFNHQFGGNEIYGIAFLGVYHCIVNDNSHYYYYHYFYAVALCMVLLFVFKYGVCVCVCEFCLFQNEFPFRLPHFSPCFEGLRICASIDARTQVFSWLNQHILSLCLKQ